jgi:transcriptional regulator with XRE-family HTH domain
MLHDTSFRTLGVDLRALRKARGLTLTDLADQMGKSVGWLSQVERDISTPSTGDLRAVAQLLDVSVSSLIRAVAEPGEESHIVRRDARRPIGSRVAGLDEELLSPDLTDDYEVVHSTFAPGAASDGIVTRQTQEVGHIMTGQLRLWIDGTMFDLGPGDSFRVRGEPFRWCNPHDVPCTAVWVISPPVY